MCDKLLLVGTETRAGPVAEQSESELLVEFNSEWILISWSGQMECSC